MVFDRASWSIIVCNNISIGNIGRYKRIEIVDGTKMIQRNFLQRENENLFRGIHELCRKN